MNHLFRIGVLTLALFLIAAPVFAQGTTTAPAAGGFSMNLGAAFGAGLIIIGAGLGIGRIGQTQWRALRGSRKWRGTFRPQ